jgi:predicted RND superfamily exporter protein
LSAGRFRSSLSKPAQRLLRFISRDLLAAFQGGLKHPKAVLFVTLLLAMTGLAGMRSLKTLVSYRDLFDAKFESAKDFNHARELFGDGNPVLLIARPIDGVWTGEKLCRLRRWLADEGTNPEISGISSVFDLRSIRNEPDLLLYPRIVETDCESRTESLDVREILKTPWKGFLTDRDGRDIAAEITFRNTPGGSRFGKFDPAPIGPVIDSFHARLGDVLTPIWTGNSMYDFSMRQGMKRFPYLNLAIVLIVLLLYRGFLGTWRSGVLLAITLALTGMIIYGAMAWFGAPMDILSSGIFMMVTVSAHQDFSFVSSRLLERGGDFRKNFRRFLVPSFFTSLTTVAGFCSLCISNLAVVRRFGFWAGMGALLEWGLIMLFLPAFISTFPYFRNWVDRKRVLFKSRAKFKASLRMLVPSRGKSLALCAVFLAVPWALTHANFSDDPKMIFPKDHPFRKTFDYLKQSRGWEGNLDLIFPPDTDDRDRDGILKKVKKLDGVAALEQKQAILDYYRKGVDSPSRRRLIEREVSHARSMSRFVAGDLSERAIVYVNTSDLIRIRKLVAEVDGLCARVKCKLSGPIAMYVEFVYQVSRTLIESLFVSLGLVFIILSFLIIAKKAPNGAEIMVASIWGPIMMLVAIALLKIPLNNYTCNFAAVLVGLTGDNSIQFLFGSRSRRLETGLEGRKRGAVFTSVVMSACSLTFLGSVFHPPKVLGLLLFFGFLACLFGDYWILKGFVNPKSPEVEA